MKCLLSDRFWFPILLLFAPTGIAVRRAAFVHFAIVIDSRGEVLLVRSTIVCFDQVVHLIGDSLLSVHLPICFLLASERYHSVMKP